MTDRKTGSDRTAPTLAAAVERIARRGLPDDLLLVGGGSPAERLRGAKALAARLRLPLRRVDLGAVVTRYIGETQRHLERLFDQAERDGALLFFDEADALFGRRSEVRNGHDRYANLEIAYLLQRAAELPGQVVIGLRSPALFSLLAPREFCRQGAARLGSGGVPPALLARL